MLVTRFNVLPSRVRSVLEAQRKTFEELGCIVEDACPDLTGADEIFLRIRMWRTANTLGSLLDKHREQMKPEAVWEIESDAKLSGADVAAAMIQHGELMNGMRRFYEKSDFLVAAVNQVPPFDAKREWPKEINGVKMEHYVAWMKSAYRITVTFQPAISSRPGSPLRDCPSGSRLWAATVTISASCRSPMPLSRQPASAASGRRSR